jgi:hypothetical protein
MRNLIPGLLMPLTVCLAVGCSSRDESSVLQNIESNNEAGAIAAANEVYDNAAASDPGGPASDEDEALMWALQRASIAMHFGRYPEATRFFDLAEERLVNERAVRVMDYLEEALLNEAAGAYRGTVGDNVGASVGRAQAWWMRGQPGGDTDPIQAQENALNVLRGLTNSVLKWVLDSSDSYRLHDDGFSRFLAAAIAMAQEQRTGADEAYIAAQFTNAEKAYQAAAAASATDGKLRYEAQLPLAARVLEWRFLSDYDPAQAKTIAKKYPEAAQPLAADHGTLLVVQDRGRRSRLEELRITVVRTPDWSTSGTGSWHKVGALFFFVEGPEGTDVRFLDFLILPEKVLDWVTAEGQVISFALPAYGPDSPAPAAGTFTATQKGSTVTADGTIAQDWDAFARFQLSDEAVTRTLATLTRVGTKQAAAKNASDSVAKTQGDGMGLVTSLGLSLVASATEGADRRHWSLQADHTVVGLLDLPAGEHSISAGPTPLGTARIQPGRLSILWVPTK